MGLRLVVGACSPRHSAHDESLGPTVTLQPVHGLLRPRGGRVLGEGWPWVGATGWQALRSVCTPLLEIPPAVLSFQESRVLQNDSFRYDRTSCK